MTDKAKWGTSANFYLIFVCAIGIIGIIGVAMLYVNMPKVSFEEMQSMQQATYDAMDAALFDGDVEDRKVEATCSYSAERFAAQTRCVWADGLECVNSADGGISCNWDQVGK